MEQQESHAKVKWAKPWVYQNRVIMPGWRLEKSVKRGIRCGRKSAGGFEKAKGITGRNAFAGSSAKTAGMHLLGWSKASWNVINSYQATADVGNGP